MIPRRTEEGWRYAGLLQWKVEREDNYGDRSTTTRIEFIWTRRWSLDCEFTRPWKDDD